MTEPIPQEIAQDRRTARRLAWWTIAWMIPIILVVGLAMGSSQAMRTAWIEDMLSIVPAIVLLVALRFERKEPTPSFPRGFDRVHSLGFLISAVALSFIGALLLFESATTLLKREHVTIPSVILFGQQVWLGWVMIAALLFSVVPPFILGRIKLPVADRLNDEVLHTDALMQKADWLTGLAGAAGIFGIGLGFWWADALAAGFISLSILSDGVRALRVSTAELIDGVPRKLGAAEIAPDAAALKAALESRWPDAEVRLRESGRYILAEVRGAHPPSNSVDLKQLWPGDPHRAWRLAELSFVPREPSARP